MRIHKALLLMGVFGAYTAATFTVEFTERELKSSYLKVRREAAEALNAGKKALQTKNTVQLQLANAQLAQSYNNLANFSEAFDSQGYKVTSEKMRKNMEDNTTALLRQVEDVRQRVSAGI